MIEFLKSTFFNLYLIAMGEVINSTHFGDSLHSNILWNSLLNLKLVDILITQYELILNAYAVEIFRTKKIFCLHIAGCADIVKCANIAKFCCKSIFGDIALFILLFYNISTLIFSVSL
jgi:hypothetical protein